MTLWAVGRRVAGALAVVWAALLLVGPFVGLLLQAAGDRWFGDRLLPQRFGDRGLDVVLSDPALRDAISNSLVVGGAVSVLAVGVAWGAARYLATAGAPVAWVLLMAPALLPPLVVGDGLARWFVEIGATGRLASIVVAHLAVTVPYAVLALVPAFTTDLTEIEHSAALAGAGPLRRLVQVVLPAARRHVVLALALAFTVSWSQYGTSLAVGGGTPMLPLVLVPFVRRDPQVAAVLDIVFLLPPLLLLAAAARVEGEVTGH